MDEAIREIRTLEEKNADLEVQLHRANTQANLSESAEAEIKIYNQKLNSGKTKFCWKFEKNVFSRDSIRRVTTITKRSQ